MLGAMRTLLLLCLIALGAPALAPALAEQPVGPSEFREYAEGHTLYFDLNGEPFGSEAFASPTVQRDVDQLDRLFV